MSYEWMKGPTQPHVFRCKECQEEVQPWQVFCSDVCREENFEKRDLTEQERMSLCRCLSEEEWSQACGKIKSARNGQYPTDWYEEVLKSGLMHNVMQRWK